MLRSVSRVMVVVSMNVLVLGALALGEGCGPEDEGLDPPAADSLVGRWYGRTTVDDLVFAEGRDVRLDEVFELGAGGTMRGDFAGWDPVSRCVVTYRLSGAWSAFGEQLDARWSSIRVAVDGCRDDALNTPETEVVAEEGDVWDDELDGTWSVSGEVLSLTASGRALEYQRVRSDFVARWVGTSVVTDFEFAEGREVLLSEVFWLRGDATMAGYFTGADDVSGCVVDYRMEGRWAEAGDRRIDVAWTSISLEVWGCDDASFDAPPTDVTADEGEIWDDELDGIWRVEGDVLSIDHAGGTLEYRRAL